MSSELHDTASTVIINRDFFEFLICAAVQHGDITVRRGASELGIEYDEMMSLLRKDCERRTGK